VSVPFCLCDGFGTGCRDQVVRRGRQKEEQVIDYSDSPAVQTTSNAAVHSAVHNSSPYRHRYASTNRQRRPLILVRLLLRLTTSNSSRISAVRSYRMFLLRRLRMPVLLVLGCSFMLHPRCNRSTSRCRSRSRCLVYNTSSYPTYSSSHRLLHLRLQREWVYFGPILFNPRFNLHIFRCTFDKQFALSLCCVGILQVHRLWLLWPKHFIIWVSVLKPELFFPFHFIFGDSICCLIFSLISFCDDANPVCVFRRPSQHSLTVVAVSSFVFFLRHYNPLVQIIGHSTNIYSIRRRVTVFTLRSRTTRLHLISLVFFSSFIQNHIAISVHSTAHSISFFFVCIARIFHYYLCRGIIKFSAFIHSFFLKKHRFRCSNTPFKSANHPGRV
jgi:hypothetical protein